MIKLKKASASKTIIFFKAVMWLLFPSLAAQEAVGKERLMFYGFESRADHTNNVELDENRKDFLRGYHLIPFLSVRSRYKTFSLESKASAAMRRYSNDSFNRDDKRLSASGEKYFEKTRLSAFADYREDTTREDAFATLGEVTTLPVETYRMTIQSETQISPLAAVIFDVGGELRNYESALFSDYTYYTTSLSYRRNLSAVASLQTALSASRFESDLRSANDTFLPPITAIRENLSDTIGLQIGVSGMITERISYNVNIGSTNVETQLESYAEVAEPNPTRFGFATLTQKKETASVASELRYAMKQGQFSVTASKATQASGNGLVIDVESITLAIRQHIFENTSADIEASYSEQVGIGEATRVNNLIDRRISSLSFKLKHRLSQSWHFETRMRYRTQAFLRNIDKAEILDGYVSLSYRPGGVRW